MQAMQRMMFPKSTKEVGNDNNNTAKGDPTPTPTKETTEKGVNCNKNPLILIEEENSNPNLSINKSPHKNKGRRDEDDDLERGDSHTADALRSPSVEAMRSPMRSPPPLAPLPRQSYRSPRKHNPSARSSAIKSPLQPLTRSPIIRNRSRQAKALAAAATGCSPSPTVSARQSNSMSSALSSGSPSSSSSSVGMGSTMRSPIRRTSLVKQFQSVTPTKKTTVTPTTTPQRLPIRRERRTPKTKKVTFEEKDETEEDSDFSDNVELLVGGALDFAVLLRNTFPPEENDAQMLADNLSGFDQQLQAEGVGVGGGEQEDSCRPFLQNGTNGYHIKLYLPGVEKLCPVYNLPRRSDFTVSVFIHSVQRMYNILNVFLPSQMVWSEMVVRKFEAPRPLLPTDLFAPKKDSYFVLEPKEMTLVVRVPKLNVRYRFQLFQKQFCVRDVKTVCMARAQISVPHYQALEIPLTRNKTGRCIPLKNSQTIYQLNLRPTDELVYNIPEEILARRKTSRDISIVTGNQDVQEILLIILSAILILGIFLMLWYYLQSPDGDRLSIGGSGGGSGGASGGGGGGAGGMYGRRMPRF